MRSLHSPFIHIALIVSVIFLIYSNTFTAPFELDDTGSIIDNAAIRNLRNFTDTSHFKNIEINENLRPLLQTRYIGYLSFALNYAVHGLDVQGYHLVNILIHVTNSLLLYLLLVLTFRTPRCAGLSAESRSFIAAFTALLFAIHPLQTQAVTYIVQRFASLAALFYLLSLVTYIHFRLAARHAHNGSERFPRSYIFYVMSLASAIGAMKTKEFAFLLPVVIALYEWMFFAGGAKKRIAYLIPYAVTMSIIPLSLLHETAAQVSGAEGSITRMDYLLTQFRVIMTYLRLLIVPINQNLEYDYPVYHSIFAPEVLLSFLVLLSLMALGFWLYRMSRDREQANSFHFRLAACGIFWFFITTAPESSIIPIQDVIFEHRTYLPSIGFFLAVTVCCDLVITRWWRDSVHARKIAVSLMVMAIVVLSETTYARNAVWGDSVRLLEDVVSKSPTKARQYYNLGIAYSEHGRNEDAIGAYQTSIRLNPIFSADVYTNLGIALLAHGNIDEAVKVYKTALTFNPLDGDVHYNLANAYAFQGRFDEAVPEYSVSIRCKPGDGKAHFGLAVAYARLGSDDKAVNEYTMVLSVRPDDVIARNNLGNIYSRQGRMTESMSEFHTVLRLKPDFVEAHYNLGNTYAALGRMDEAQNEYRAALRLKPDFIEARRKLEQ